MLEMSTRLKDLVIGEQGKKKDYCSEQCLSHYIRPYKDNIMKWSLNNFEHELPKHAYLFINNILVWQYYLLEGYKGG